MLTFGLENVKAFRDTGDIALAPINIFVGQNSCGKSSFIRFPAVLSQSMRDGGPSTICLHSDRSDYIDYGNFEDVLHNHEGKSFSCKMVYSGEDVNILGSEYYWPTLKHHTIENAQLKLTYAKREFTGELICEEYEVGINGEFAFSFRLKNGNTYEFRQAVSFDENDRKIDVDHNFEFELEPGQLFSESIDEKKVLYGVIRTKLKGTDVDADQLIDWVNDGIDAHELKDDEMPFDVDHSHDYIVQHIPLTWDEAFTLAGVPEQLNFKSEIKLVMRDFRSACKIKKLLDRSYTGYISRVHYIGPFRQDPERIYRREEKSIHDVGKGGEMASKLLINDYIRGGKVLSKVSDWYREALGYEIEIKSLGSEFYQICFKDVHKGVVNNIMDVGFGISQILPIVSQIVESSVDFLETDIEDFRGAEMFIIEQPELHLHPAAQSKLADLFVGAFSFSKLDYLRGENGAATDEELEEYIKGFRNPCRFLIETHSEHLIRALQVMIADPDCILTSDMVKFYYVESGEDGSVIREMKTNEYGQFLERWPKGFFDEAHVMSRKLMDAVAERNSKKENRDD